MNGSRPTGPSAREALQAWFLGPQAENAQLLEGLITEALRDHVFWRRNYRPEDGFAVREIDKRAPGYEEAVATLTQELMGLLAELKRGVPFFSGRYKGHMLFEQTLASIIGYFAAMLYNPNNVAVEASPVTTRLELEVGRQLAAMIGYDPGRSWGHLTSGGTVANFEAIWMARNVAYLPIAAVGAARDLGLGIDVALPDGSRQRLDRLGLWELLNISNGATLDLYEAMWAGAPTADVRRALDAHSLGTAGYQDYTRRLREAFGDPLPPGVVLVAATAHYSWNKIMRALGIGSNQLVHVPVDTDCRMNPNALWDELRALARRRVPVLACVSVCATTEESAVDRLDQVLAVRTRAERELGVTFHIHSDAAFGGYAAAITRRADGGRRRGAEIRQTLGGDWPSEEWVRAMEALAEADSVTVDPHKMGYVPYPAGAILVRDRRTRELVATDPAYILSAREEGAGEELTIGRYILEGSKPGAAAAAVWLSHKVLPLDERGYGYLIEQTVLGARRLYHALGETDLAPFRVVRLPEPDINIVCYVVTHPSVDTLQALNRFNERIYAQMSLDRTEAPPEYIVTRTRFESPMYDGAVGPVLSALGVCSFEAWRASPAGLTILRSTVMDPFVASPGPPAADHVRGYVDALRKACEAALPGA